MRNFDVLIIGGGIIGLTLARELHRRGLRQIAVVDRGKPGREASYAAAGMLAPNAENEVIDDFYRFCDASRAMFPQLAAELLDETGIDIELDRSGTLYAAFTEDDSVHLGLRHARQQYAGIPVERLSAAETLKAEPSLSANVRESLYFPNDWQVENRKMLAALLRSAQLNKITIIEDTSIDGLKADGPRVIGASAAHTDLFAGMTVLATGAWTSFIKIGSSPVAVDIRPIRGQLVSFRQSERLFKRVIYSPRGYLVPRADGRVLAGATVEDAGFDNRTTDAVTRLLRTNAVEIASCLGGLEIAETWAGLRPFAADGLPIIGTAAGYDGVLIAAAHYRNGILLSPITADTIADSIVGGVEPECFRMFDPAREINKGFNANATN